MSAPDLPPPPQHLIGERPLYVHLHAERVSALELAGGVVVVIDAIRASVTIAKALSEGARAILPVLTAEEAREKATALRLSRRNTSSEQRVLLGGERGGVMIDGFDLDNSPFSYQRERVGGASIVFTTSNGTAGLLHAKQASKILVGSFVNLTRVCNEVALDPRPVHILCCGTRTDISLDDVLVGGAMAQRLIARGRQTPSDDSWQVATMLWERVSAGGFDSIIRAMCESRGGRNMVTLGLRRDVEFCSTIDAVPVLPVFDASTGIIDSGIIDSGTIDAWPA